MENSQPVIRPVRLCDTEAVLALAVKGGDGLTNLPPQHDAIASRIAAAVEAMDDADARERGAAIMLVAELCGEIVATGMIFARVGAEWPFYSYRITRQSAVSRALGRAKAQRLLNLVNDFDGETEVGGLFVDPARRGLALGRLMARSRYMFIAQHRDWFGARVMAELRGYQDGNGRSPVWDALGRHFYDMEFHEADRTGAIQGNQFIADLGPRYPIYISMLPEAAQAALGRPHDDGRAAHAMLLDEGFRDDGYVDIFDGGPTLVAPIDAVRTVRACRRCTLAHIGETAPGGAQAALVGSGSGGDFRVAAGQVHIDDDGHAAIARTLAAALSLGEGDAITIAPD
ncbi:MAG: arginine N-succinyltransferase [Blastomonas sp. CACIA14H2]|uniref:arginine N-succinyltransferase n=1 Tax=Blastomonas sp. CACIA14H2 TaxID=1419876 RepID=UPI0003D04F7F|nr:MAG: arginine N-succinyltransferase [Blastomonas sp. CACIA14H2]